ncbi:MAG: pyridoxal-phosphate dependent enzyme, partial [Rhodospirillaceae bacterium]|nr:pyridoxal-phosphate dependent enzyme [Rhodospirillaceae bacterium]
IEPIGGGGIISGLATAAKSGKPAIEIIGVESEFFPTMFNAVRNEALPVGGDSIAEGIAVKSAGMITREIIARLADDMLVVSESAIESAVQTMLIDAKIHTEGAGASPLAAVLGVIVTMGSISEPPEILGGLIAAALVGTFLGILLCYGFFGPMAASVKNIAEDEHAYFICMKAGILAYLQGYAPAVTVEFARKVLQSHQRPTFAELEEACGELPPV